MTTIVAPHIGEKPAEPRLATQPQRLMCLDAYRGLVMLLMASGGLGLPAIARHFPASPVWQFLSHECEHAEWRGCRLWDLIQPSFTFLAGAAMTFSYVSRRARGQSTARLAAHVLWRSLALVALGVFLASNGSKQTNFTFEDTLTQIGLGYGLVYLLMAGPRRLLPAALALLLAGWWCVFYLYPAPGPGFDYRAVGLPQNVEPFAGLAAHWNKNTNLAAAFDGWFLNLFPRRDPFAFNRGGYQTLNFVPTMGTMLLGVMAGWLLQSGVGWRRILRRLGLAAAACFATAILLDPQIIPGVLGGWCICPIVKRIWTPSWVLLSGGWTLLMLAGFFWIVEVRRWRGWAMPLVVVGMNSIAMYVMAGLLPHWIRQTLQTHLGQDIFAGTFGPLLASAAVLAILWLACLWLYRRRIFLRL